jgi:ABC-2 type transport system ATP-binding protein
LDSFLAWIESPPAEVWVIPSIPFVLRKKLKNNPAALACLEAFLLKTRPIPEASIDLLERYEQLDEGERQMLAVLVEDQRITRLVTGDKRALRQIACMVSGDATLSLRLSQTRTDCLESVMLGLMDHFGHPAINAKASLGVVPQELLFDAFFTAFETLELQAGLFGVPKDMRRTMELLKKVRLDDKAHVYSRTLSGGMKRRLLIAKALVHNPPVVILDEPTAGVDIELRQMLWAYVRELHAAGTTVVLTTHYLEEAEELCDRIAIVNHGRIVADSDTKSLLAQAREKWVQVIVADDVTTVPAIEGVTRVDLLDSRRLDILYDKQTVQAGAILARLQAAGLSVVDVTTREADLEDVFLELTGTPLNGAGG